MLYMKAVTERDVRAARVYMECVGGLIPRRQVDVVVHDARLLTDEQLRAELSRALQLLDGPPRTEARDVIDASSQQRPQLSAASSHR